MITQYGMSKKFGLMGLATQENQYLSGRAVMNCGDDTATEVDHEVMTLLHDSYEEAKRLIGSHREALDKIAAYLIRRETITGKEFMIIFRAVERGVEIPENLDEAGLAELDRAVKAEQEREEAAKSGSVNLQKEPEMLPEQKEARQPVQSAQQADTTEQSIAAQLIPDVQSDDTKSE